jgi:SAM-dependent methyltransferase
MTQTSTSSPKIEDVKSFWDSAPLFSGESKHEVGSKAFFEEHVQVYYDDVFAGRFDDHLFIPRNFKDATVLDLGCGVGFWTIEIQKLRDCSKFYSGDLTENALAITKKRLATYGMKSDLSIQNAEKMTYKDKFFDHVNCQGVIHHTPDTDATVREIARVLKKGGTASISVYYKNFFLRNWSKIRWVGKGLSKLGGGLKGRGRESIFSVEDEQEIVRYYDGSDNPIGKAYTKQEFIDMLSPYFEVHKTHKYFFPARSLPIKLPKFLHRFLSTRMGFMIHANLVRK